MNNQKVEILFDEGAGGSPSQPVSSQPNGSIEGADQLSKLLKAQIDEALKPVLAEVRGVQGRQDKDRTEFRGFLDEYERQKKAGKSNADAELAAVDVLKEQERVAKRDALIDELAQKVLGKSAVGNGAIAHADIVKQYNLDASDPQVIAEVLSQTDPKDAKIAALELVNKRSTAPTPSASAASMPVTTPARAETMDDLRAQYKQEFLAARGNRALAKAVQDKFRKAGLDLGTVGFSV